MLSKRQLREKFLAQRAQPQENQSWTVTLDVLCAKLAPKLIIAYWPMVGEADPREFIQTTKIPVFLPQSDGDLYHFARFSTPKILEKGRHGVLQPPANAPRITLSQAQSEADLWIVPGVAFDLKGHRLGMGKGNYDRFLNAAKGQKVGLCYNWQLTTDNIPTDPWDHPMNYVVTESRCIAIKRA